jgi:hypothetical protein
MELPSCAHDIALFSNKTIANSPLANNDRNYISGALISLFRRYLHCANLDRAENVSLDHVLQGLFAERLGYAYRYDH